ncbi:MAG: hypothetical protein ABIQ27_09480 [Flavobacterium sp.]|uniref:hypothetical protein n=1 Tax=Flavobacterium sp. TaxID=239 RepID=UPI00326503FF
MGNSNQLKLPDRFIIYLENLPEHGMGYQTIDIELFDGRILTDRIVFNSTYLKKLDDEEKIEPNQIKNIKIK